MNLNNDEIMAIETAAEQYFEGKTVEQKCPRCGNEMIVIAIGNSYEVRCKSDSCIVGRFRGI